MNLKARSFVLSLLRAYKWALSPLLLDSFEANDASTIITVINPITSVQMALISGFTPNRTSE